MLYLYLLVCYKGGGKHVSPENFGKIFCMVDVLSQDIHVFNVSSEGTPSWICEDYGHMSGCPPSQ